MIDVSEKDFLTIKSILEAQVPDCEVRAFGSRVTWTAKDHSDLDLVIVGSGKLENGKLDHVKRAMEESSLPFRVDVLDWHRISREFQHNIEKNFTVIKKSGQKTSNGWRYIKVADFAEVVGGGTPKTGVPEYWGGDIPWITPKDLSDHNERFISRGERSITKEGLKNSAARLVPENTVLLTSRAPVGYLAIAKKPLTTNQGFRSLIIKEGFSPEFIYYLLLNNVDYLKQHASGSTFQELSGSTLKNLQFQIPPLPEQFSIAKILSDLDDKIELNQQMNKILKSIAQALFKQWFVEFEFPGHDKVKLVKGLPEGWKIRLIGDVLELAYGKALKEDKRQLGEIPVYGSNGQIGWHNESLVKGPSIVIGRKGNPGIVTWAPTDFFPIDTSFYVVIKDIKLSMYYLLHALLNIDLASLGADSAVPGLNRNIAYNTEILIPTAEVIKEFDKFVKPLFDQVLLNDQEAAKLSQMRDSLLPKLMSGRIRIKESMAGRLS